MSDLQRDIKVVEDVLLRRKIALGAVDAYEAWQRLKPRLTPDRERERILLDRIRELEADAGKMTHLRRLLHDCLSASIFVNDAALNYKKPEPGCAVKIVIYPETAVGSVEYCGDTLDAAIDAAREGEE